MQLSKAIGSPYPLVFTYSELCDCHFKTAVPGNFTRQWNIETPI